MPILDNLLSALGLERKARPAARPAVPGSSGSSGALPLSGWSAGFGYGTSGGYGSTSPIPSPFADVVPWHLNPVVAAGIAWFARNFPVPDLHVVRDGGADDGAEVDGHWLPKLFDKPNELWSFFDFFAASVMSDITDGNTFWLKRKDGKGAVVDLWWLEPWGVQIVADPTRTKAVLGYRYDSGDVHASYSPDEVLHVRAAQPDRADPRRGMSPLSPVDRSIRVTTELCRYDEAILKNGGASPGVFAPTKLDGPPIPQEDIGRLQSWYKQNATGPNAGSPIFAPFGLQFLKTGFSPEELSLDKLPRRHVSFILAAIGLSPMVLGYEDESKTYANFAEACRSAYENALMPMQARFAEAINHDEDFISEGERLRWDYAHVTYLQDDRAAKIHSLVEAVGGGILDANEARAELHYEPKDEEPAPEPPAQPTPPPGAEGDGAAAGAGSAAPADIAALLAARGGGNGKPANGKPVRANGQPARPAAKSNPHHDQAGRFAHGSGPGGGGPGGGGGPLAPPGLSPELSSALATAEAGGRKTFEPWYKGLRGADTEAVNAHVEARAEAFLRRESHLPLTDEHVVIEARSNPWHGLLSEEKPFTVEQRVDGKLDHREGATTRERAEKIADGLHRQIEREARGQQRRVDRAVAVRARNPKRAQAEAADLRRRAAAQIPALRHVAAELRAEADLYDPAGKTLPGLDPAAAPTDADLARRTAAVLDALEAKLLGRKSNPHHDAEGRFAHGSGSGGGGPHVAAGGQRVYQAEADAARRRLADLDESAGGRHVLEFGPPETARDRKALAKAEEAGRPVAVRATLAPEHRVVEEGGATHHEVGGDRLYSVLPDNSEGAGGWTVRRHYFDREGSHEDFPHRTRVRAEQHASAEAGKVARSRTETDYLVGHSLSKLKFHKYTAAPGYRTTFRVLVPEGEPSAKGVAGAEIGAEAVVIDGIEVPIGPAQP